MTSKGKNIVARPEWLTDDQSTLDTVGSQIGLWRWDFASDALEWSDGLLHMVGLERSAFGATAKAAISLVHPDDRSFRALALERHLKFGEPYKYVYRFRHCDGRYIHCRTEGTVIRAENGTPIGMAGITLDISGEAEAIQKLRDSERRLGALAAGFEGAIFRYHLNADGTDSISYMSEGAERMWNLKPGDVIENPDMVWTSVHRDDLQGVKRAFAEGSRTQTKLNLRWRILPGGGEIRWIECRASPKRTAEGNTIWDGFVIDISEMVAARDELQRTTEMLGQAQKREAIGQISGGIAHDFNNLLAVILGNAELIDQRGMDQEDLASLAAIITSCEKGADLTRRLLSFARKSQLDPRRVSLRQIVTDMVPLIQRTLPEDIEIIWDKTAAAQAAIDVDVGLLESSILNILLNARDAMPSGGSVVISIEDRHLAAVQSNPETPPVSPGRYASLRISDTGDGIAQHMIKRVTEPFVTTKGPELGSGLGLAMVDGFVAQSGGFLDIQSVQKQGTVITLNIPLAGLSEASAGEAPPDPETPRQTTNKIIEGRALLVEDEEQVRLVTARILRRMGIQVDAVANAAQALALLRQSAAGFDVLLTDIVMPGAMNGLDLALEAKSVYPHMPVVLMTGYGPDQIIDETEALKFGVLLNKPIERKELEATVVRALSDTSKRL